MYTMRKTPRSSFFIGTAPVPAFFGDTQVAPSSHYVPVVAMPPQPTVGGPPVVAAPTTTSFSNYLPYAVAGGVALVAYLLIRKG